MKSICIISSFYFKGEVKPIDIYIVDGKIKDEDFTTNLRRICLSLLNCLYINKLLFFRYNDDECSLSMVIVKKYNHLMKLLLQTDFFEKFKNYQTILNYSNLQVTRI